VPRLGCDHDGGAPASNDVAVALIENCSIGSVSVMEIFRQCPRMLRFLKGIPVPSCDMAYFKDLTRYEYTKNLFMCAGEPLNIGWLERCATFPKGVVGADLTAKLLALCKFSMNRCFGWHGCHFCEECPVRITDSDGDFSFGSGDIRVPAKDERVTYVAPDLIYHYVVAHQYLPPDVFLDALSALSVPKPVVVWILECIEIVPEPETLWRCLDESLRCNRPSIPLELRGSVAEAANELKAVKSTGFDAQETAKGIVNRLKWVLTRC
jgi:hypothetical protein